jgi:hypothetical protein
MPSRTIFAVFAVAALLPISAMADGFNKVTDKSEFVTLVSGKTLKRTGIRLQVASSGTIVGRGMGRDVQGDWRWDNGYFCRDLFWGKRDLGFNCQQVEVNGSVIRFTSDKGAGQYADLRME